MCNALKGLAINEEGKMTNCHIQPAKNRSGKVEKAKS
jgi:hypothetical protein